MKKTFIPNWYKDKKNYLINKRNKVIIMMTFVINILIFSLILNISAKIENKDLEIMNKKSNIIASDSAKSNQSIKADITTIEKYKEFNDFLNLNNLSYHNIIVTNLNIELDMKAQSYEEYIAMVKTIEDKYRILKLIPEIKMKENVNFKVIIEV